MNSLTIFNAEEFEVMQRLAKVMVTSNYFSDAKEMAQAFVKIQAGKELGMPPFASMTGIHIIQGKPALGANVIATLIKNDPRYNYRVLELSADVCRIQFYEGGEPCGISEFTIAEARKAGTKNLDKFPKNMLFARTMSNGAKWYTPGIFGGAPVYTPDELGADVDEDGNVVEGTAVVSHVQHNGNGNGRPPAPPPTPEPTNDLDDALGTKPPASNGKKPAVQAQQTEQEELTPTEYLEAAVSSVTLPNFAQNVLKANVGYERVEQVVTALTSVYAEEMDVKFFFPSKDPGARRALVNWLVDRKLDAEYSEA